MTNTDLTDYRLRMISTLEYSQPVSMQDHLHN